MNHGPKCKIQHCEILEYNTGANLDDLGIVMIFKMQHWNHGPWYK